MTRRIALLIGNTDYKEDNYLKKLITPAQNIRDFERVLKDPERCGFTDVIMLENASKTQAERRILELFTKKGHDDLLLFYFAGHGVKSSDGALYFAMHESERDYLEATAVAAAFVKNSMSKTFAERVVVILDCCFSGAFGGTMSTLGESVGLQDELDSKGTGKVILTATNETQYAWDRTTDEVIGSADHSVFTRYLIEGLTTGDADRNSSGEITIDELYRYIHDQMLQNFPKQNPMRFTKMDSDLVIARNPNIKKLSKDLLNAVTNVDQYVRMGAVHRLEELLYLYDGQNPTMVAESFNALQRLANDRSESVAQKAKTVLHTFESRDQVLNISGVEKTLHLFISSPADVQEERNIVRKVVERLNNDEELKGIHIETVAWDDPDSAVPFYANDTPQATINEHMRRPSECDIVIVVFGSRMGTPLPDNILKEDGTRYESGTEWEYEDAVRAAKVHGYPLVQVYRNDRIVIRSGENAATLLTELQRLQHFFQSFNNPDGSLKGGYNLYSSLEEFDSMLEKHLRISVRKLMVHVTTPPPPPPPPPEPPPNLDALIEPYLNWILEQHSELELRGLGGDARLPKIPLEKVYVALKGSRSSSYEREQSQALLYADMIDNIEFEEVLSVQSLSKMMYVAEQQALIDNPFMPSLEQRDRPDDSASGGEKTTLVTLGDAFCKERWMVILGDPGSGKTTLARWIALKLAHAMVSGKPTVTVPAYQVDPKVDKSDQRSLDIGPTRLPVLLRVSEFSEAYQKARENKDSLALIDFLGHHTWLGNQHNLSSKDLNELIKQRLRQGKAVIILDGMDEITASSHRDDIVHAIETFINNWINARGESMSMQQKNLLWNSLTMGDPARVGGNQILITSRIAGYHSAPITGQVAHVTIQPMQPIAVKHFCDAWTYATYQVLHPEITQNDTEKLEQQAAEESEGLKAAIYDDSRPRVRELASNPLLVTILALVYRNNKGRLPEQRAELYQKAMEILIEAWRINKMTTLEVTYVLSPLAAHIHQQHSSGLIEESDMKEIIRDELARYRNLDPENVPPSFFHDVDVFVDKMRTDVGLLSERGENLYGFLHLTFQEYLAALFLVRDRNLAAERIIERLTDPRWREPILMCLGHISVNNKWGSNDRQRLLSRLLEADDPLGDLIPRSALLIVSAIPEMARVNKEIIEQIVEQLLQSYAERHNTAGFETLRERIEKGLNNLYKSSHRPIVEASLIEALSENKSEYRNMMMTAADIIARNKWSTPSIIKALVQAQPYDDARWNYPIMRVLKSLAMPSPELRQKAPVEPQMSSREKNQLDKLEKTLEAIENGSHQNKLKQEIALLEAEYQTRVQSYISMYIELNITPLEHNLEELRSGKREKIVREKINELNKTLQKIMLSKERNEEPQPKEMEFDSKQELLDFSTRSELRRLEQELREIVNGTRIPAIETEIITARAVLASELQTDGEE